MQNPPITLPELDDLDRRILEQLQQDSSLTNQDLAQRFVTASFEGWIYCRDNAQEFALMVEAGMTPLETIRAATVSAADHAGLTSEIGTLAPGKAADIVAVKGDPLTNIRALETTAFVMKGGAVAKPVQ